MIQCLRHLLRKNRCPSALDLAQSSMKGAIPREHRTRSHVTRCVRLKKQGHRISWKQGGWDVVGCHQRDIMWVNWWDLMGFTASKIDGEAHTPFTAHRLSWTWLDCSPSFTITPAAEYKHPLTTTFWRNFCISKRGIWYIYIILYYILYIYCIYYIYIIILYYIW